LQRRPVPAVDRRVQLLEQTPLLGRLPRQDARDLAQADFREGRLADLARDFIVDRQVVVRRGLQPPRGQLLEGFAGVFGGGFVGNGGR